MISEAVTSAVQGIANVLNHALSTLTAIDREVLKSETHKTFYADVDHYRHPQTWGNTTLGFGGLGGQAVTGAYTDVVISQISGAAVVYHGGRLAYIVREPGEVFYEDLDRHCLVGKSDSRQARYKRFTEDAIDQSL